MFISHSMGGPVTTRFLRLYTDMAKGIVYVDSFIRLMGHYMTDPKLEQVRQRNSDFGLFVLSAYLKADGE